MNDKELIERYIYQVVRRLPKSQRDEVGLELQELISDMAEEEGSVEATLIKLGDPAEFAKKYMDQSRHLIGPAYYDTYLMVLKIALLCSLIAVFVVSLVEGIAGRDLWNSGVDFGEVVLAIISGLSEAFSNTINTGIGVFGIVTLVFAIMERQQVDFDGKKGKKWSVSDLSDHDSGKKAVWTPQSLSPVPHSKAMIKRSESIVSIVFTVIFCVLLIFAPRFFGIIVVDGDIVQTVPIFNLDQWNSILPVFMISLLAGLADDILRLLVGRYNLRVMFSNIVFGGIQMICSVIILKILPLWNPDFSRQLETAIHQNYVPPDFLSRFDAVRASDIILAVFIFIFAIELITTVYRTLRYGLEKESASHYN